MNQVVPTTTSVSFLQRLWVNILAIIAGVSVATVFVALNQNATVFTADLLRDAPFADSQLVGDISYSLDNGIVQFVSSQNYEDVTSIEVVLLYDQTSNQFATDLLTSRVDTTYALEEGEIRFVVLDVGNIESNASLLSVPYTWPVEGVVVSHAIISFADGTVDQLLVERIVPEDYVDGFHRSSS